MSNKTVYLSALMQGLTDKQRLTLYTGVARAIRRDELTGLQLAERMSIVSPTGVQRDVHDYMVFSDLDGVEIVKRYAAAPVPNSYTRAQAEAMSPEQLLAAITQQRKRRRRSKRLPTEEDGVAGLAD